MAELTVQEINEGGLEATYSAAAEGGDTFQNDSSGKVFVHVKNGSASQMTVTVTPEVSSKDVPGFGTLSKSGVDVDIPASEDRFIGPFPYQAYAATPELSYSDESDVTVAALKV